MQSSKYQEMRLEFLVFIIIYIAAVKLQFDYYFASGHK